MGAWKMVLGACALVAVIGCGSSGNNGFNNNGDSSVDPDGNPF